MQIRLDTRVQWISIITACLLSASLQGCGESPTSPRPETAILASTPKGITTVEVVHELLGSQPNYHWTRLGNVDGMTLLVSDRDAASKSTCVGACAEEFPPVPVSPGAVEFGDWSLVAREDGSTQWAYQGRPLHRWNREKAAGELAQNVLCEEIKSKDLKIADGVDRCEYGASTTEKPAPQRLLPPQGWRVARYEPAKSMLLPPFVEVRRIARMAGDGLVDARGRTLYAFSGDLRADKAACSDGEEPCADPWVPLVAPALANPVGDFGVAVRRDGTKQWTYSGKPLYSYAGDHEAGDANGADVDPRWKVALLGRGFTPDDIVVRTVPARGDILATRDGRPLYTRHPFEYRWGGRNSRNGFGNSYMDGKALGTQGCDADCLREWRPLAASPAAVSSGYWEVFDREDGTRQWAYKGYALYTYTGDSDDGAVRGSNLYEYVVGTEGRYSPAVANPRGNPGFGGGAGLFWHVARP